MEAAGRAEELVTSVGLRGGSPPTGDYANDSYDSHADDSHSGGHHDWWRDRSELVFTHDAVVVPMIMLCVAFEMLHHHIKHLLHQKMKQKEENKNKQAESNVEQELERQMRTIRRYLEPYNQVFMAGNNTQRKFFNGFHTTRLWDRMSAEFMVLGFIALTIWIVRTAGVFDAIFKYVEHEDNGPDDAIQMVHVVEGVHVALFLSMIMYFAVIFFTVRELEHELNRYGHYERRIRVDILSQQMAMGEESVSNLFASTPMSARKKKEEYTWMPQIIRNLFFDRVRTQREYTNMRNFFMQYVREFGPHIGIDELPENFDFACYMRVGLDAYADDLISVHRSTWVLVIMFYGGEILLAANAGLQHNIIWYNIVVDCVLNLIGYLISFMVHYRFRGGDGVPEMSPSLAQVAAKLPANAEIYFLRLFQALVMFTTFSFAIFIVDPEAYKFGGEERDVDRWVEWLFKIFFVFVITALMKSLVPALNKLLRLPPFLDEKEARIICMIRDTHRMNIGDLLGQLVEARQRGDTDATEEWADVVEGEMMIGLTQMRSRFFTPSEIGRVSPNGSASGSEARSLMGSFYGSNIPVPSGSFNGHGFPPDGKNGSGTSAAISEAVAGAGQSPNPNSAMSASFSGASGLPYNPLMARSFARGRLPGAGAVKPGSNKIAPEAAVEAPPKRNAKMRWTKAKVASLYFPRIKETWVEVEDDNSGSVSATTEVVASHGPSSTAAGGSEGGSGSPESSMALRKTLQPMGTESEGGRGNPQSSTGLRKTLQPMGTVEESSEQASGEDSSGPNLGAEIAELERFDSTGSAGIMSDHDQNHKT